MKKGCVNTREYTRGSARTAFMRGGPARIAKQGGFTLIELLVTVAIISLLASIVLTSVNDARAKARDAVRLQEMKAIQTALELYKADNGVYPSSGGELATDCHTFQSFENVLSVLVEDKYLPFVPHDPLDSDSNLPPVCYAYESPPQRTDFSCGSNNNPEYILHFHTEDTIFNLDESPRKNTSWKFAYCLSNAQ